ncbi:MAG TPA: hypothetical protein VF535_06525, partial [Allosphingosinicella sp.]
MNPGPTLGFAAAALLLAGAGGAALAHPHPDGDGKPVKRFVIIEQGKGDGDHAAGERVRRFEILRDGEPQAGAGMHKFQIHDG